MSRAESGARVTPTTTPTTLRDGGLVEYTDDWGRKFLVYGESSGSSMIYGPVPLDALELPQDVNVRLHNELFNRGLLTADDVRRRPNDVLAALQIALRVNVQQIQNIFVGAE